MRSIIRIDIDETFASWDALRDAIEAAGVPPPNLAVAHVEHDGRVVHPHAYWLLAQAVCFTERGRLGPQRLLRAMERALVDALHALGADPGGLSNTLTGKNPLSPLWSCQVMSATPFNLTNGKGAQPGLMALADHVRPIFERPRASAAAPCELDVATLLEQSNGLFEVLKRFTFAEVARFHPQGRGQGDFEDFAHETVAYALRLPSGRLSETALEKRARRQAQFAWDRFDRQSTRPGRGRCQAACTGKPLREKQQIGALAVADAKRQQSLDRLVAAYRHLVDSGKVSAGAIPINRDLAAQAGMTVRTLQKHRTALQAAIRAEDERRCPDKKQRLSSPETENTLFLSPPSDHPSAKDTETVAASECSGQGSKVAPPLALLTIASSARELAPNEPSEQSSAPTPQITPRAPEIAPGLAGLVLFPPTQRHREHRPTNLHHPFRSTGTRSCWPSVSDRSVRRCQTPCRARLRRPLRPPERLRRRPRRPSLTQPPYPLQARATARSANLSPASLRHRPRNCGASGPCTRPR